MKPTSSFQIRWAEPLGRPDCPYMRRWVLIAFGFSIRLHHWSYSDDKRFFHDHPWSFITIILRGSYKDVSPDGVQDMRAGNLHFRKSTHKHYVDVPPGGAWTLLLTGRPNRKWGFWIKANQFFRPLRYFSKYGHPPCVD